LTFNVERASKLMHNAGINVILASTRQNIGYITGYWHHIGSGSADFMRYQVDGQPVTMFAAFPSEKDKEPFIVASTENEDIFPQKPWIKDVRVWGVPFIIQGKRVERTAVSPVECVAEALKERGLDNAVIGVESEYLSMRLIEGLRKALPKAVFRDATPVLWQLRMVKSPEEVRRLRKAAEATEKAVQKAFDSVWEDMTELELLKIIKVALSEEDAVFEWAHVAFGAKGATVVMPTAETRLKRGDAVRLDVGGVYRYYLCDMSRVAVFGTPSGELVRAHAAVVKANKATAKAVKPGVKCSDLHSVAVNILKKEGYTPLLSIVGHGVGIDVHEPPFLSSGNSATVEPGMVIAIEIALRIMGVGSVNVEDEVLVTEDGNTPITTMRRDLQNLG